MITDPWNNLSCCVLLRKKQTCPNQATHVVIQPTDMSLLFKTKAGVVCDKHKFTFGGIVVPFTELVGKELKYD